MEIKNATGPKADEETKVFTAFIRTQSWEVRSEVWEYHGDKPIDFVSLESGSCIGVELCEWMDREQAQWVAERERFRAQIQSEIKTRGLHRFEYFGPRSCCTVQAFVTNLPGRGEKAKVIDDLIEFMVEFELARSFEIYQSSTGIAEVRGSLVPVSLAPFFAQILFYSFPTGTGLSVPLTKATVFEGAPPAESDSAIRSLRQALTAKTIEKAEIYEAEKAATRFVRSLASSSLQLSRCLQCTIHRAGDGGRLRKAPAREPRQDSGDSKHSTQRDRQRSFRPSVLDD